MISHRLADFHRHFDRLPDEVQAQASAVYALFERDPYHPSLHFKRVVENPLVYSVRIGLHHRALARRVDETLYWFWISTHAEYDQLLKRL